MTYSPDRGDIVWLDFNPQAGHEQAGRRPALVLSPRSYNERTSLLICCPITNKVKGYPFEVKLPDQWTVTGAILSDQVKSFDWKARNIAFIVRVPDAILKDVIAKLNTLLR